MPRNYKGQAGSRTQGTCDESKLQEDLNKIAAGQSQRYVCTQLGLVWSTLQNSLKQKHMQKPGRPTVSSDKEELAIAEHLLATAKWSFPFDSMNIMMLVKNYLNKLGQNVEQFKNNVPGPEYNILTLLASNCAKTSQEKGQLCQKRQSLAISTAYKKYLKIFHHKT